MEQVRLISTPFLMTAIVFCLYGLWYIKHWRKKNPWYNQNDDEMRLSPQERAYRQNERRKYNNMPCMVICCVFTCLIPMMLLLQKEVNGGWNPTMAWMLMPLIGGLFLAAWGIKRK